MLNKRRRQFGLQPIHDPWPHILGRHVIVASDKEIVGLPRDLKIKATQTGYLHLQQKRSNNSALGKFLASGPPPVYAGFGSMPRLDQENNVSMIVDAVRLTGQRVAIAKFWEGPSLFSNAEDVFFIKHYPHRDLFPHMAAVIHHGGAGTTATTAISGVPQIIVPHVLDQYYWGHYVYQARLGSRPIKRSRMTSQRLASAIQECLSDDMMRRNAKTVARKIKQRDSVSMTVKELLGFGN